MEKEKKLSQRERLFCMSFALSGDIGAAMQSAEIPQSPAAGEKLLCREEICAEICKYAERYRSVLACCAAAGYYRLAFGSISDAAALLFTDGESRLKNPDLFSVAEIKRPKDGAMEIKFFDKLKALEKLCETAEADSEKTGFYDALLAGAQAAEGLNEDAV